MCNHENNNGFVATHALVHMMNRTSRPSRFCES